MFSYRVMPTTLSSFDEMRENGQLVTNGHNEIDSSKEMSPSHVRGKRLFFGNYFVVSTTLTTYFFVNTTVTKSVNLGGAASVSCVPVGYAIC